MAASRRSSLMKDNWRADEDHRPRPRHRVDNRREPSISPSRNGQSSGGGLWIKGRAAAEDFSTGPSSSHRNSTVRQTETTAAPRRDLSPARRRERGEDRERKRSEWNLERGRDSARDRQRDDYGGHRRRSGERSRTSKSDLRHAGPRSPPAHRTQESTRANSPHRERVRSPPSRRDLSAPSNRFSDSHAPYTRRSSQTPPTKRAYRSGAGRRGRSRSVHGHRRRRPSSSSSRRSPPLGRYSSAAPENIRTSAHRPRARSPGSGWNRRESPRPTPRRDWSRRQLSQSPPRKRSCRSPSRDTEMQHPHATSPPPPFHPSYQQFNRHPSNAFPMHPSRSNVGRDTQHPVRPPPVNTHHPYTASPQWTPTSSHHGSPHSASPHSYGRGGWNGPHQSYHPPAGAHAYSPPQRQNSYPPQQQSPSTQYYQGAPQDPYHHGSPDHHGFASNASRGNHSAFRGNHFGQGPDRRLSGSGPSPAHGPQTGRTKAGHFQNLQWTAGDTSRTRKEALTQQPNDHEDDNLFRPSKDLQVEDEVEDGRKVKATSPKEDAKVSFKLKSKAPPSVAAKPLPDLSARPKDQAPLKKHYQKEQRHPGDRPNRDYHDKYRSRDSRYAIDTRHDRHPNRDRGRERSPEPRVERKIIKDKKPQRTLSPGLADSSSVYYRKPGNESVVGSGTYGKVFKAVHVYTKNLVALKKIRMDGEKDGFPVTAVREIKLLQSLSHENVVALQEVMVENNDCYMVFEYLSHDLTGLLNHPTFKLEHTHKKHLARQLFEGLNYLHRRGVLHRDIKAANILISSEGQLKLADFGLARFYSKRGRPDYTNRVITIWYRSPELLLGETQYGPAVDVWSAACVMVEIFTRHAIFPGDGGEINQLDKIYNVLGTPTRSEWPGLVDMAWFELLRPTEKKASTFAEKYQERVTPAAFELLTAIFLFDPSKRPTAAEVLEHPYFTVEEPPPQQAIELKDLKGDWHEFESKALRKENERKQQEARRALRNEEHDKERAKRRPSHSTGPREPKKPKLSSSSQGDNNEAK